MSIPDLLRRLGALFAWPTTERRTVFVHSDDPWYELFYDGRGQAIFEYRSLDGRTIQRPLTGEQVKEFGRRGPAYIAEMYHATAAGRIRGATPAFDPAVEQRLRDDYPELTRLAAAKDLARYGADRPHRVRVQMAVLGIARGNVHVLKKWMDRAEIDWRWPLQQAGDVNEAVPLRPGATGIDPATGAVVAAEGTIEPRVTRTQFKASRLFSGESWSPREVGEAVLASVPLTLDGFAFHPALRFDEQRLAEVWLEGSEVLDTRAWLNARLRGWEDAFAWGTVDVEGDAGGQAIVVRFTPPPSDPSKASSWAALHEQRR